MAEWHMEWGNDGWDGRMAEWQNGRMSELWEWRTEWSNGRQNGRTAGMADGMVKWWEWLNGGNGGQNGRMADRNGYIRTIYGTH